jgi:endoglycosylceramidase
MRLFDAGARLLRARGAYPDASPDGVAELWLTREGRATILGLLEDAETFASVIDAAEEVYASFDRTSLMPLYHRVARAVREEDSLGILFLEASMASNSGVRSHIAPLQRPNGTRDPQQAYAPHGYDLVTDTDELARPGGERVDLIFRRHDETARRLDMPLLVGEWGAYGHVPGTLPAARRVVSLFEALLCGETYWAYVDGLQQTPSFRAIHRPYPERVAGTLRHYHYDASENTFTCAWDEHENIAAPTLIYIPDWLGTAMHEMHLTPTGRGCEEQPVAPGSANTVLRIQPTGAAQPRQLTIHAD